MTRASRRERQVIGWREWVSLPGYGVKSIKVKVDTGARTSSLHAFEVEEFLIGKRKMIRFKILPEQRHHNPVVHAEAPLIEYRRVTPSSGHSEMRPVILAEVGMMGEQFELELTLTRRDHMGFRMLLGRQAIRERFVVDPGRSFLGGRRLKGSRLIKKKRHS